MRLVVMEYQLFYLLFIHMSWNESAVVIIIIMSQFLPRKIKSPQMRWLA